MLLMICNSKSSSSHSCSNSWCSGSKMSSSAKTIGDGGQNAASGSSKTVLVLDSVSTVEALVDEEAGVGGCVGMWTCNEGSEMLL